MSDFLIDATKVVILLVVVIAYLWLTLKETEDHRYDEPDR